MSSVSPAKRRISPMGIYESYSPGFELWIFRVAGGLAWRLAFGNKTQANNKVKTKAAKANREATADLREVL